jgi:deazaflavin-dependent oxidoreductase (nitroreductase family)
MLADWLPGGYHWFDMTTGDARSAWAEGLRPVNRPAEAARAAYDRTSRWYRFTEEPFERRARATALDLLAPREGEAILEIGPGTGPLLVRIAAAVGPTGRVVGLDLSRGMLNQAAGRARRAGLAERVELRQGDARALPFGDAAFDGAIATFTLDLFDTPDIPVVLAEIRRVLRPGGRLVVASLSRSGTIAWPTRLYERLHDRFPSALDCRPIRPGLAMQASGFVDGRSVVLPLWGLRAEVVAGISPGPPDPSSTVAPPAGPVSAVSAPAGTEVAARPTPPAAPEPAAQPAPPRGVLRWLLRLPAVLYRARLGRLLGHRFLLLVHTGRRTGLRRETVLEVVAYDATTREAVVAAGWGRRTQWLHNVEAGLAREVWIGGARYAPAVRVLAPEEAVEAIAGYERRNRFMAPVVRGVLSRLLGWRYDGSDAARRRLVGQLPLVGFRPARVDEPGPAA